MNKKWKTRFFLSFLLNVLFMIILLHFMYKEKVRKDFFKANKLEHVNKLADEGNIKAVFIGNSITENWMTLDPDFFLKNQFVCKGIGGQSSSQLLLRFRQDVVNLNPDVVVINAGSNDIAEADGFYNSSFTLDNIQSMIDIAKAHGIKVIVTSVLPATQYKVDRLKTVNDVSDKIKDLNKAILDCVRADSLTYGDYYKYMLDNAHDGLKDQYTVDGVHPNMEGYAIMEKIVLPLVDSLVSTKIKNKI